jgi:hypothetical protein
VVDGYLVSRDAMKLRFVDVGIPLLSWVVNLFFF